MRARSQSTLQFSLAIALLCIADTSAHGWGSLSHWMGAPPGYTFQINLPDIWQSRTFNWWQLGWEARDTFAWGHSCQREGSHFEEVAGVPVRIPDTPTAYGSPSGVELSGWDMYHLVKKMSNLHRQAENEVMLLMTARGWVAHNRMDSFVHFTFFLGGTASYWVLHHGEKEMWADYLLLVVHKNYPTEPWGSELFAMGSSGHPGIICLAMKCFRKNGQTVDKVKAASGNFEPLPVENRSSLSDRIDSQDGELSGSTYTETGYIYYANLSIECNWSFTEMLNLHAQASTAAQAAVDSMP